MSDFLTPGDHELDPNVEPEWERSMRRLGVRNQVLAIEVVDRREIEFPNVGDMLIRDPETNFERYVNTSDANARARMDAASAAQRERIRISLRRAGVGHIQLRTDRDWVQDIARFVLAYRRVASMLHAPPQGVAEVSALILGVVPLAGPAADPAGYPAAGAGYLFATRRKNRRGMRFTNTSMLEVVVPKQSQWRRHLAVALSLLSLITLTAAFARPKTQVEVPASVPRWCW